MNQLQLDTIGTEVTEITAQLNDGLITLTEYVFAIARFQGVVSDPDCTAGLVCPFTGIRYPTVAETDAFMASMA